MQTQKIVPPKDHLENPVACETGAANSGVTSAAASLDAAELLAVVEDNAELLAAVVSIFKREGPAILQQLQAAAARGDFIGIEQAAHKLKGSTLSLCAVPASQLANQLELLAGSKSLAGLEPLLRSLEMELDRLMPELEQLVRQANEAT